MTERCREVQRRLDAGGPSALLDDDAACQHLLDCAQCFAVLEAVEARAQSPLGDAEHAGFERCLRKGARLGPASIGVAALLLSVAVAMVLVRARKHSALEWEGPHSRLASSTVREAARGEEGQMGGAQRNRNRFGIEGPSRDAPSQLEGEAAIGLASKGAPSVGTIGFGGLGFRARSGGGHGEGTLAAPGHAPVPAPAPAPVDMDAAAIEPEADDPYWVALLDAQHAAGPQARVRPDSASAADSPTQPPDSASSLRGLLARAAPLEGLRFQDPNGWFANTYVPSDPAMRALQARLSDYDRNLLLPASARAAQLERGARRPTQPFDPPSHAALSLYMAASERGTAGPRRLLLQVGLQGTDRRGGLRPAMNVGLVLDLREALDPEAGQNVRALLAAFAAAREPSDRFALFAAGRGAGLVTAPEAFRNGPLSVAVQQLLTLPPDASAPSLTEAVREAQRGVLGSEDGAAPLGSTTLIVIEPGAIGSELPELAALAQRGAIAGVPLSVVAVGRGAPREPLTRLALAGQGNLRALASEREAQAVVERELSSLARVVARAVRLRIKLAPGVELVEVLGSHRLGARSAARERAAERSIDRRLSRELGIERDRDDDETGIQMLIPSFHAGDNHVVLLDVVAPGPGPLADVSVRFKDLLRLDNGIARESLGLENRELARGAPEFNVLKNLAAHVLSHALREAGAAISAGVSGSAREHLRASARWLQELGSSASTLATDRDLARDLALTSEYDALLEALAREDQRRFAADSLRFAALLKLQPRPAWEGRAP